VTINAKYDGKCTACGGFIAKGTPVDWTKGVKGVRHAGSCPAVPTPKPAPKARITDGDDFDRAKAWLESLPTPTEFEQSLINQLGRGLTERQIEVCLNAINKAAGRKEGRLDATTTLPGPDVIPAGRYAVETGDTVQLFRVWRGTRNPSFIKLYEQFTNSGTVTDNELQFGQYGAVLAAIIAQGIETCSVRYGRHVGRCGKCGLRLTDRVSIELGIGPVCGRRLFGDGFLDKVRAAREKLIAQGVDPDERVAESADVLENLRIAFLMAYDNFSTGPDEVAAELQVSRGEARRLLEALVEKGIACDTVVNGAERVWQCNETYDSVEREEAERIFDEAYGVAA
jgi:hypothetical protein